MLSTVARRFLLASEPFTQVSFWAQEVNEAYEQVGLDPFAGYFCGRSAGMGRASPSAVTAAFFNFSPTVVEQFLRWDLAEPAVVADARVTGTTAALARLLEGLDLDGLGRAGELLREAVDAAPGEGRTVYLSTKSLPWPEDEIGSVWFGATLLREFRGDGHIAVLVGHGLSGPEALLLHAGYVEFAERYRGFMKQTRVWPEEVYDAAAVRLRERGFLAEDGSLTDAGMKFREMIEMETDRLATPPFEAIGPERSEELIGLMKPWSEAIVERKGVPRTAAMMTRDPAGK